MPFCSVDLCRVQVSEDSICYMHAHVHIQLPQEDLAIEMGAVGEPVTIVYKFSDLPARTKCPNCAKVVTTQVTHEPGTRAWMCCLLFFLCG